MSLRNAYSSQITICNLLLVLCGLAAVGLAGSQFSIVGLNNYKEIDLRILNWIPILAGVVGIFCVTQNHGSILAKTLYILSVAIAVATCIFYGFTTYRIVDEYRQLMRLQNANGFQQEFSEDVSNYSGKIAISAVMIGLSFVTAIIALISVFLLNKLVYIDAPIWPPQTKDHEYELKSTKSQLVMVSLVKFFLGLGTLGLCAFMEYERELLGVKNNYINIALDHITAIFVVTSACIELIAIFGKLQFLLNIKVGMAFSVIAAVWCLKSIDLGMYPFYKNDLSAYRAFEDSTLPTNNGVNNNNNNDSPYYIIAASHGVLLGVFGVNFLLCVGSTVLAAACLPMDLLSGTTKIEKPLKIQAISLSFLHILWACCLIALVVLGLVKLPWNGAYIGGDLLYQAMLFLATGLFASKYFINFVTIRFVLSICALSVAVEKTCSTANLIYQSADRDIFKNGVHDIYVGQIVLYSVQAFILGAEALTALLSSIVFGRAIINNQSRAHEENQSVSILFSLGTLFYGIVLTGCYVVFELGYWRYDARFLDTPFFRIGNGPLAIAVFIIQIICVCHPKLLASTIILQCIVAAISTYVISLSMTNTYYLRVLINSTDILQSTVSMSTVLKVGLILAASATIACVIATISAAICIMRSSYILHHGARTMTNDGTDVIEMETSRTNSNRSNIQHATPIQTVEEQTVYWSADEHPGQFNATRRFYSQPYAVDNGFTTYSSDIHEIRPSITNTFNDDVYREVEYERERINSSTQTEKSHSPRD
uniref:Spatacsin_C domain-containing protein n=1 Tax=Rhabditophanes sp. KR3021 TaxID=114890 RepID=A0AC35UHL5_9BILA